MKKINVIIFIILLPVCENPPSYEHLVLTNASSLPLLLRTLTESLIMKQRMQGALEMTVGLEEFSVAVHTSE